MPNLGSQLPHQEVGCSETQTQTQTQDMRRAVVASDVLLRSHPRRHEDRMKEATPCMRWTAPLNFEAHWGDGHCVVRVAIVIGPNKCLIQNPRRAARSAECLR